MSPRKPLLSSLGVLLGSAVLIAACAQPDNGAGTGGKSGGAGGKGAGGGTQPGTGGKGAGGVGIGGGGGAQPGTGGKGMGGAGPGAGGMTGACTAGPDVISDFEQGFNTMIKQGGRTCYWLPSNNSADPQTQRPTKPASGGMNAQ